MKQFERVFSSSPWEAQVGYCRAVRAGNLIFVTGCAPVGPNGKLFAPGQPYEQARRCIEIIDTAIKGLGGDLTSVVRTRMFVTDVSLWREFGRAHHEFFKDHPPATSMVQVAALNQRARGWVAERDREIAARACRGRAASSRGAECSRRVFRCKKALFEPPLAEVP